jgi:DNA-binding MarR family transcriptional regulator
VGRRRDPNDFVDTFGAVKRCITAAATKAYAAVDVGSLQGKVLRYIGNHSRTSQAELARATASDPTLTSRTLASLIERGLVRRERSDEDRREYLLELSAAGRRVKEKIEHQRTLLAAKLVGALDERDLDDFDRIAAKILATFAG